MFGLEKYKAKLTAPVHNTAAIAVLALLVAILAFAMSVGVK